ncbi:MAG: hypothetical protein KatS3mg087_1018 [Patescibacteria group bacterium]|nr:MAG: hypothetical protein KatS3mg087_1018 [Patescibacteria group bacterium]
MIDFKDIVLKYIEELRIHEYQVSESAFPHYHSVPKSYDKNLRYRQKLLERCEENQDLRIEVLQKCKSDVLYYINTFVWTYSPKDRPNDPVVPFITYNYQDYVIEKIYKSFGSDDIVIVKSRDMGATWMTLAVIEWAWHFHKSQAFLLVSRKEEYVDKYDSPRELFWKIDFIHKHQPYWMKPPYRNSTRPRDPYRRRRSLINAVTGATISGEATVEDVARGDRQTAIMIDEAAAIADLDKINASTRDATNCRIFVSTPKGHGVFEDVVELAHKEDRLIVLHWSMHPEKSKGLYCLDSKSSSAKFFYISGRYTQDDIPVGYEYVADGKLRSIWYDRECTRATNKKEIAQELDLDFHQSGGPVFSVHEINKLLSECKPPLKRAFF